VGFCECFYIVAISFFGFFAAIGNSRPINWSVPSLPTSSFFDLGGDAFFPFFFF